MARKGVQGDKGGGGEGLGALLRASIDSLYDSINATDTPLVAGGALVDKREREGSPSYSPRTGPSSRLLKVAQLSISDEVLPPLIAFKGDLQHGLDRLEGHPAYYDDEYDDRIFWSLIEAGRRGIGILESTEDKLLTLSAINSEDNPDHTAHSGLNNPGGGNIEPSHPELLRLQSELAEAREDLKSDEETGGGESCARR